MSLFVSLAFFKICTVAYCHVTYSSPNSPEQSPRALILQNNLNAVKHTPVFLGLIGFRL